MWWFLAAGCFVSAGLFGWGGWTIAFRAGFNSRQAAFEQLRAEAERSMERKEAEFQALLKLRVMEAARHRDQEHLSSAEIAQLIADKQRLAEQIVRLRGGRTANLN